MQLGRVFVLIGLVFLGMGLLLMLGERIPFRFGRLPGDIVVRGKNSVFYFPLTTSILLSAFLSLVLWLIGRR